MSLDPSAPDPRGNTLGSIFAAGVALLFVLYFVFPYLLVAPLIHARVSSDTLDVIFKPVIDLKKHVVPYQQFLSWQRRTLARAGMLPSHMAN